VTKLEVRCDPIEVTCGGLSPYGPPPDLIRRFVAGPPRYFVDGHEVTEDEFADLVATENGQPTSSTGRSAERL